MSRTWRIRALRQSWVGGEDFCLGSAEASKGYPGGSMQQFMDILICSSWKRQAEISQRYWASSILVRSPRRKEERESEKKGGREEERKGEGKKKREREGGRDGGKEEGRKRENKRERKKEKQRKGEGREKERKGGRERRGKEVIKIVFYFQCLHLTVDVKIHFFIFSM